jgi:SAM-dependent methyltransferase
MAPRATLFALRQRNSDVLFAPGVSSARAVAAGLRIADDVHSCIAFGRFKVSQAQLDRVALSLRSRAGPTRLLVTADGPHFARPELRRWLVRELGGRGVTFNDDVEDKFWVFCIEEAFYFCLECYRSGDASLRDRRIAERTGSLPPTIAAAMAFLGSPSDTETVLDPVCGTGTLLAEAHAIAPGAMILGVDRDAAAIAMAKKNLQHLTQFRVWEGNGAATGLAAGSVHLFLANLPFGKQYGSAVTNPTLYRSIVAELLRLGAPCQWRAVLLTADAAALASALDAFSGLTVVRRLKTKVLGEWAEMVLVRPNPDYEVAGAKTSSNASQNRATSTVTATRTSSGRRS